MAQSHQSSERPHILLVSESSDTISKMSEILSPHFEVMVVSEEDVAVQTLSLKEHEIDLVIIENIVFNRHGIRLMKEMRGVSYLPEYIMIIHSPNVEVVTSCMKAGATDCISKPLNPETVLHKVKKAVKEQREDTHYADKIMEQVNLGYVDQVRSDLQKIIFRELQIKRRMEGKMVSLEEMKEFFSMAASEDVPENAPNYYKNNEEELHTILTEELNEIPKTYKANVLVIEDEEDWRETMSIVLDEHHHVYLAEDGKKGLELCQSIENLDCIFLDVRMPEINGNDLIPHLLKAKPDVKIIMVTAFGDMEMSIETIKRGAFDFITKPFSFDEVLSKLNKAIRHRLYPQLLPELINKLERTRVSFDRRVELLQEFLQRRADSGELIRLDEVFVFFPECRKSALSPYATFPPAVILNVGVRKFVEDLNRVNYEVAQDDSDD